MNATVTSIKEQAGKYGGTEKVCSITLDDGNNTTVYVKDKAHWVYNDLKPGVYVELKSKDNGPGYLIQKVVGEAPATPPPPAAPNGQAPARAGRQEPSAHDIAEYIKTASGQYAYCVKMLQEKFKETGVVDITDDLLKAGATSIFIATKDKFH